MNNKGQVLVTFILLIPLLLMSLGFVYIIGNIYISKNHTELIIKDSIEYSLKTNNDIKDLITKNVDNIEYLDITKDNSMIYISLTYSYQSTLNLMFNNTYDINLKYKGTIQNDKIIIERVK